MTTIKTASTQEPSKAINCGKAFSDAISLILKGTSTMAELEAAKVMLEVVPYADTGRILGAILASMVAAQMEDSNPVKSIIRRSSELVLMHEGHVMLDSLLQTFQSDKIKNLTGIDAAITNMSNAEVYAEIMAQKHAIGEARWNRTFQRCYTFNTTGKHKGKSEPAQGIIKLGQAKGVQKHDADGNPMFDDKGNPVLEDITLIAEAKRAALVVVSEDGTHHTTIEAGNVLGKNRKYDPNVWPNTLFVQPDDTGIIHNPVPDLEIYEKKVKGKRITIDPRTVHEKITAALVEWENANGRPFLEATPENPTIATHIGWDIRTTIRPTIVDATTKQVMGPALEAGVLPIKDHVGKIESSTITYPMQASAGSANGMFKCPRCSCEGKRKTFEKYYPPKGVDSHLENLMFDTNWKWRESELCGGCRQELREAVQHADALLNKHREYEEKWLTLLCSTEEKARELDALATQLKEMEDYLAKHTDAPAAIKASAEGMRFNTLGIKKTLEQAEKEVMNVESAIEEIRKELPGIEKIAGVSNAPTPEPAAELPVSPDNCRIVAPATVADKAASEKKNTLGQRQKPHDKCACGSNKKYKKCCGKVA